MAISVFLADDSELLMAGFQGVLQPQGITVVEKTTELQDLAERFVKSKADVLVIDVRFRDLANKTGLDICEKLLKFDPLTRIVVLSQFEDQYVVERAYRMGVLAFVLKDEHPKVLNEAIVAASKGQKFLSPEISRLLAWGAVQDGNPKRLLDENEMRVFKLAADGATVAEIATEMDLSAKWIGMMMRTVKSKLGVDTPADITKLAIRYGITSSAKKD